MSDNSYEPSQQPASTASNSSPTPEIKCPSCGATQFFGGRKISGWGWFWLVSAILNLLVSIPLIFIGVGFFTIFLTPLMMIGFQVCRKHVNTCARCKREF